MKKPDVRSQKSETRKARRNHPSSLATRHSSLPFVFVNFAMTADGKTAFTNHKFIPFATRRDREHMMELRATADAVMSGARTVDLSPATLGTGGAKYRRQRLKNGLSEHNLRVIVSGSGSIDSGAEIFRHRFSPIIILTTRRAGERRLKKLRKLAEIKICGQAELNFHAALRWLRKKWNVKRLLCEGGGELSGALFRAGLVDELHLTISPKIFGGRNAPTIADGTGFQKLSDAAALKLKFMKRVGGEIFLVFDVNRKQLSA
jgi:2,5-diamino-6-(ribosylamino)-4(3H)-pyrimidinone 5'-phosphate reductase